MSNAGCSDCKSRSHVTALMKAIEADLLLARPAGRVTSVILLRFAIRNTLCDLASSDVVPASKYLVTLYSSNFSSNL